MSRKDKLLKRFLSKPNDFTFDELTTLLGRYDYYLSNKGKTSGSRIRFVSIRGYESINLHKPHNRKCLLKYEFDEVISILKKEGLLW